MDVHFRILNHLLLTPSWLPHLNLRRKTLIINKSKNQTRHSKECFISSNEYRRCYIYLMKKGITTHTKNRPTEPNRKKERKNLKKRRPGAIRMNQL